jgi:hypothetical protein
MPAFLAVSQLHSLITGLVVIHAEDTAASAVVGGKSVAGIMARTLQCTRLGSGTPCNLARRATRRGAAEPVGRLPTSSRTMLLRGASTCRGVGVSKLLLRIPFKFRRNTVL